MRAPPFAGDGKVATQKASSWRADPGSGHEMSLLGTWRRCNWNEKWGGLLLKERPGDLKAALFASPAQCRSSRTGAFKDEGFIEAETSV